MKSTFTGFFGLCGAAALMCGTLFAHHGTSVTYQLDKTMTLNGTVTEWDFAYPHPQLYFDVKDDQGNVVHWGGEIAPNPAQLVQAGWGKKRSEAALAPATAVTITLSPSRLGIGLHIGLVQKSLTPRAMSCWGPSALIPATKSMPLRSEKLVHGYRLDDLISFGC